MGKLKDKMLQDEECNWEPSKHGGKQCPIHGGSDLSDVDADAIKKAGGLDADRYRSEEDMSRARVKRTETIFTNRINDIVNNPENHFTSGQLKRLHNYAVLSYSSDKDFLRKVAFKMVVSRFSPEQAMESVYYEYA